MYYFFQTIPLLLKRKDFISGEGIDIETWLGTVVFILVIFCGYNKLHIQTW